MWIVNLNLRYVGQRNLFYLGAAGLLWWKFDQYEIFLLMTSFVHQMRWVIFRITAVQPTPRKVILQIYEHYVPERRCWFRLLSSWRCSIFCHIACSSLGSALTAVHPISPGLTASICSCSSTRRLYYIAQRHYAFWCRLYILCQISWIQLQTIVQVPLSHSLISYFTWLLSRYSVALVVGQLLAFIGIASCGVLGHFWSILIDVHIVTYACRLVQLLVLRPWLKPIK